jgi:protein-tyrosine-phosphatase
MHRRSDLEMPTISSAGTIAMEGTPATRVAVAAARDRGVDISRHAARRLTDPKIAGAAVLLCMAAEHREEIEERVPDARDRTFTLKELTRLLEHDATPADIEGRVAAAARGRDQGVLTEMDRFDEDVVDPLGMPIEAYREIAFELEDWTERLVAGFAGPVPARAEGA